MDLEQREALVRRLAAAIRGVALYKPEHPLVSRAVDALATACQRALENSDAVVIGFLGDDVVADGERLVRSRASFAGFTPAICAAATSTRSPYAAGSIGRRSARSSPPI